MLYKILFLFVIILKCGTCANILVFVPMPLISHQLPFRTLVRELSLRGHNVTYLSPYPITDPRLTNLTEHNILVEEYSSNEATFGVMFNDSLNMFQKADKLLLMIKNVHENVFEMDIVKKLLNDASTKYDLVIFEAQFPYGGVFSWKHNCPTIAISSLDAQNTFHLTSANSIHPIMVPDQNIPFDDLEDLSFFERLVSAVFSIAHIAVVKNFYSIETQKLQSVVGKDFPGLWESQKNISLLFVTTNPIFHNVRAVNPTTINLAHGMHVEDPKPLPKELQKFLNESTDVIYFSLGSTIPSRLLSQEVTKEILSAFTKLNEYKFIFKTENTLKNVPKNVLSFKWVPQQDLLRHPNVKLFITQGGLQSLQEGLINNLPMVGIPFLGDQYSNVNKMVKKGFGVKINERNITEDSIIEAVLEVMTNNKYRDNARKYGKIIRDTQISDIEKAVWWIEYVIRHNGASHLKSIGVDMPFWKYYMLDICLFVTIILSILILVLYKCIRLITKFICKVILQCNNQNKPHKD